MRIPRNALIDAAVSEPYFLAAEYDLKKGVDHQGKPSSTAPLEARFNVTVRPFTQEEAPEFEQNDPANPWRLRKDLRFFNVSLVPEEYFSIEAEADEEGVSVAELEGKKNDEKRWLASRKKPTFELFVFPPPGATHAYLQDATKELSNNSANNRAFSLFGTLEILRPWPQIHFEEPSTGEEDKSKNKASTNEQQRLPDGIKKWQELIWTAAWIYFELHKGEEGFMLLPPGSPFGTQERPHPGTHEIVYGMQPPTSWLTETLGLPAPSTDASKPAKEQVLVIHRSLFWQSTCPTSPYLSPWVPLPPTFSASYTLPTPSGTIRNRQLKPAPGSVVYSRYISELGQRLSYRLISAGPDAEAEGVQWSKDALLMTKWQNSIRVNSGWRQRSNDTREHWKFCKDCEEAPDRWGLMGYWDDEPWGYVEIYWVKESNVAGFYRSSEFDMGFHALVGDDKFRGAHRVRTWMGAAVHVSHTVRI